MRMLSLVSRPVNLPRSGSFRGGAVIRLCGGWPAAFSRGCRTPEEADRQQPVWPGQSLGPTKRTRRHSHLTSKRRSKVARTA